MTQRLTMILQGLGALVAVIVLTTTAVVGLRHTADVVLADVRTGDLLEVYPANMPSTRMLWGQVDLVVLDRPATCDTVPAEGRHLSKIQGALRVLDTSAPDGYRVKTACGAVLAASRFTMATLRLADASFMRETLAELREGHVSIIVDADAGPNPTWRDVLRSEPYGTWHWDHGRLVFLDVPHRS